jgi:hypothetical protein
MVVVCGGCGGRVGGWSRSCDASVLEKRLKSGCLKTKKKPAEGCW